MWNLKYDTGELVYKTETDNRNRLTDIEQKLMVIKEERRESYIRSLGIRSIYIL